MSNTLLGGAIGDALGVFAESKLPNYQPLLDWDGKTFLGSEYHDLKPGQFSDDTQMSIMVAQSLIQHGFNPQDLSERYVEWITSDRARGYGKTTLLAVHNLMEGKHWSQSGVPGSFGNGSAMRAAPFGIYFRDSLSDLLMACKIDSAITHASEEAEAGSIAIAMTAAMAVRNDTERLLDRVHEALPDSKVKSSIYSLSSLVDARGIDASSALAVLGTKADVRQTVPSALYLFMKCPSYEEAVVAAIRGGHDTDTTAAIVGALFGAKLGMQGIPADWVNQVEDRDQLIMLDSQLYNRSNGSFLGAAI